MINNKIKCKNIINGSNCRCYRMNVVAIMDAVFETGAIQSENGALVEKLYTVIVDTTETEY